MFAVTQNTAIADAAMRRQLLTLSGRTGDDLKCLLSEVEPTDAVDARMAESDPKPTRYSTFSGLMLPIAGPPLARKAAMKRHLSAILAADVVGYSALMERDEAGTFARLKAGREQLFEPEIERHHGRVFKLMGDGLLAEFGSVVDAVECAVALQRGLAERNAAISEDERFQVRIGINLGEVIVEGDDRYGEGVNIAARLEELAEPGGIYVSGKVSKEVEKKLSFAFEPLGERRVKNVAEPVQVYRVNLDGTSVRRPISVSTKRTRPWVAGLAAVVATVVTAAAIWYFALRPAEPPTAATTIPSIAVLPFDNMGEDQTFTHFGDGVAEDIISMLSRAPDLAVIARNSSFAYKGKSVDLRQVGRELRADYVLEGSVRKDGDKVRIVAQLIEAGTGNHVWAERYDNVGTDPWALQDEVTQKIVTSLSGETGKIKQAQYKQAWGKDATDLAEYDYYLRGHELFFRWTKKDNQKAVEIWREGLVRFPSSSLLRVNLAWGYAQRAFMYWSDDPVAEYRKAGELAREALDGANVSPQARRLGFWVLAIVDLYGEKNFESALANAKAARAVAPYDAYVLGDLSQVLTAVGQPDEALAWLEESRRRDPGLVILNWHWAWAYYVKGDYEKAIEAASRLDPSLPDRYILPAASYVRLGRMDEARSAVAKIRKIDPGFSQEKVRGSFVYSDPRILERQLADLAAAGLQEK